MSIYKVEKENDQSEMYDVREYIPGDDIRSVHWKLSSKVDQLLLRQASDPTHYHVVLLPDFTGKDFEEKDQTFIDYMEQINGAVPNRCTDGKSIDSEKKVFAWHYQLQMDYSFLR